MTFLHDNLSKVRNVSLLLLLLLFITLTAQLVKKKSIHFNQLIAREKNGIDILKQKSISRNIKHVNKKF